MCCLQESHFRPKDAYRLKMRGWKNIIHENRKQKKTGVAILTSDKIDLQFGSSVMSDSLWSHELQHTRPPCPAPTPGVHSNSCPLSQWCHPAISSSVIHFSCLQFFPASGSFQMSQFFPSGSQSIGISASASVLPLNVQDWFPLRWTGWISLQSKGNDKNLFDIDNKQKMLE